MSFQKDFLISLHKSHDLYNQKFLQLYNDKSITNNLSINESEKMIHYLKEYKKKIHDINNIIDNIIDIKRVCSLNEKIDKELILKIIPIMHVYRALLYEKYTSYYENPKSNVSNVSNSSIYDLD